MVKEILQRVGKAVQTMRLFARVGLGRMAPKTAYNMARYWVLANIFKRQVPWLIELSVTYRCQARCEHCSVANYISEASGQGEMDAAQIENILDQTVEMGIPKVDYFGGEPLIRRDIAELVRCASKKGLYISLTTNGYLLTKELTRELKKAGINCINVSLDSVEEEEHDRMRKLDGLYKRAIDAIRFCRDEGIPCIVSTYVTRNKIKNFANPGMDNSDLTKILRLSRELGATAVRILFPIIAGEWVTDADMEFTQEEAGFVIDNIDPSFAFIEGPFSVKDKKKVCQSLRGKMFNISPYGEIQLCVAFTDVFGNVKDKPLKELLKDMYNHPVYVNNKGSSCCSTTGLRRC